MEQRRISRRPFEIEIGTTRAHCERCRCEFFSRTPENMAAVRCLACGAQYPFALLLKQVSADAGRGVEQVAEAEASLEQRDLLQQQP